jgi:maltose phosphorylase
MNKNLQTDPWCIVEENFDPNNQLVSEKLFGLSNGYLYQQANFEEYFSGDATQGAHFIGISSAEKSEKLINAANWTGIIVRLNDEKLDLASWKIMNFRRVLNMREGFLERSFEAVSSKDHHIQVFVKRFLSFSENEVAAITCSVKSVNFEGRISFMPVIDGDINEQIQNSNEPIWNVLQAKTQQEVAHLWTQTRHTDFHACIAMTYTLYKNNEQLNLIPTKIEKEKVAGYSVGTDVKAGDRVSVNKFVAILNSLNHPRKELTEQACILAQVVKQKGWNKLFEEHSAALGKKWLDLGIDTENAAQNHKNLIKEFQYIMNVNKKEVQTG